MFKFPIIILVKLHVTDSHVSGGQRCLAYLLKQGNLHICLCCLPYLCLHAEKEKAKRGVFMRNHPLDPPSELRYSCILGQRLSYK
jgi:hypothetical protein